MAWQSDKLKDAHKEMVEKVIHDMEEGKVFFWDSQHFGRPPRNICSEVKNGIETRRYHGKNNFILSVTAMAKGYKDCHILGYGFTPVAKAFVRILEKACQKKQEVIQ